MGKEMLIVPDPVGNSIYLLQGLCFFDSKESGEDVFDDAVTVISKPALIIESGEGNEKELHYYRYAGGDIILLISVHFRAGRWEAYRCMKNPSVDLLASLLRKGRPIF